MGFSDTSPSDTYLQTNDQINSVLARYEAFKRGETPPASIPTEFLPGKNESLSLIDFDDSQAGSSSGAGAGSTPADDLAGLFNSSLSLTSTPATSPPLAAPLGGLGVSPLLSNIVNQPTSTISPQFASSLPGSVAPSSRPSSQFGQIKLPSTPPLQNHLHASGRVGPSSLGAARASPSSNPTATSTMQPPLVAQASSPPPSSQVSTPQGKDPFADLVGLF
jgi:ADP-ribosylation factor-binding protein GGA